MNKNLLRRKMMEKRDSLSFSERQSKSHAAALRLFLLPEYKKAAALLIYLPFRNEVNTLPIIENAWHMQKQVVVPVCMKNKGLLLSQLSSLEELAAGTYGIPEPKKEFLRPVSPSAVDLAIIPGLAFDLRGQRMGYGGGYFDRFLDKLRPDCPKIALAYEIQLCNKLPSEKHDIPVNIIITENTAYYTDKYYKD